MDDWLEEQRQHLVAGIPAKHWIRFFSMHTESSDEDKIQGELDKLAKRVADDPDNALPVERE